MNRFLHYVHLPMCACPTVSCVINSYIYVDVLCLPIRFGTTVETHETYKQINMRKTPVYYVAASCSRPVLAFYSLKNIKKKALALAVLLHSPNRGQNLSVCRGPHFLFFLVAIIRKHRRSPQLDGLLTCRIYTAYGFIPLYLQVPRSNHLLNTMVQ